MMSEWLVDVPIDLSMEWLMKLCPNGRRNLVIASQVSLFYSNGAAVENTHCVSSLDINRTRLIENKE